VTGCWHRPGAKFYDLYDTVDNEFLKSQHKTIHTSTPQIYILAGICNLTTIVKRWVNGARHEELIVVTKNDEITNTLNETKSAISDLQNFILRHDAIPIFCTIYPSSISDWNATRVTQGKTDILVHAEDYHAMQSHLEEMVENVNQFIVERNVDLKMKTPLLHRCLWHNRGPKSRNCFNYSKLTDGCHASTDLNTKIGKSLLRAIHLNSSAC
jgi:hypothetical protein